MDGIKIGFVLLSAAANPIPSTRIAVLNMFPLLRDAGFDPDIAYEPAVADATPDLDAMLPTLLARQYRVVVFQKVSGPSVVRTARALRAAGVKTVYYVCDVVDALMADATDATAVVTAFLGSLYPASLQHKIHVVHDGIEHPDLHKPQADPQYEQSARLPGSGRGSRLYPLRAVLVTSVHMEHLPALDAIPSWLQVRIVGRYASSRWQRLQHARWTLRAERDSRIRLRYLKFLANPQVRCVPWEAATVYSYMLDADIGIIPIEAAPDSAPGYPAPNWKVKSENRLTMKMCLGLPVVATPIPAYEPVVKQGENGFLANSGADWTRSLEALRDPELRRQIGSAARASVLHRYSMAEQARLLSALLHSLLDGGSR